MCQVRIENWAIVVGEVTPYTAPEATPEHLIGFVFGHPSPDIPDGGHVTTSIIEEYDLLEGWMRTSSRKYQLGAIRPDYLASFKSDRPDVYELWKDKQYTEDEEEKDDPSSGV